MRLAAVVAVLVAVAAGAFALGRTTADGADGVQASGDGDFTVEIGDQLSVPALALFCTTDVELATNKLLCNHTGDAPRWQVIFEPDRTRIVRIGDPGDVRVFSERR